MPTYLDEKRRRICQFADHLRLMGLRRHKVVKEDCFIVFDDSPCDDAESPKLKESVAIKANALSGGSTASGNRPSKHGKQRERRSRYIQFAFMRDCFYVELPNNTLFPPEADQILRCRLGFYWAKSRRDLRWVRACWEDMVEWTPLQKVYIYRDEQSAAEDMAFILFQIWHFPVDTPLFIRASAFYTHHRFENGQRIE